MVSVVIILLLKKYLSVFRSVTPYVLPVDFFFFLQSGFNFPCFKSSVHF